MFSNEGPNKDQTPTGPQTSVCKLWRNQPAQRRTNSAANIPNKSQPPTANKSQFSGYIKIKKPTIGVERRGPKTKTKHRLQKHLNRQATSESIKKRFAMMETPLKGGTSTAEEVPNSNYVEINQKQTLNCQRSGTQIRVNHRLTTNLNSSYVKICQRTNISMLSNENAN